MQQLLSSLEEERERQFRRFVAISAGVHVALALLFWIGPIRIGPKKVLPVVERVALVETAPAPPAAKPAQAKPAKPEPVPAPPPPPPPPPLKKVLPKQPAPVAKPKPPEPKAKPEPKAEPKKPEPAEQDLDDVLAELRNEKGEEAPHPPAAAVGPAAGPGMVVDPATARWIREVKIHVTRAWILPAGFRTQALITIIDVDLSATGQVLGTHTRQSSGNPDRKSVV